MQSRSVVVIANDRGGGDSEHTLQVASGTFAAYVSATTHRHCRRHHPAPQPPRLREEAVAIASHAEELDVVFLIARADNPNAPSE